MAGMSVLIIMWILGVIFITYNVITIAMIVLTLVFGTIRIIKKEYKKTSIVFLIISIVLIILEILTINILF